jgi:hypothetical protein
VRFALALCTVLVVAVPGTTAAWTDPVNVSGSNLTAGTADLKVQGSDAPTWTAMNALTMEGGDSTAGVLTVSNAGNVPLSYYVDASATNADGKGLGAQLAVKVTSNASTSGSSPNVTCAGSALSGSGTTFATGLVASASNRRTLGLGASETLCIEASLPHGSAALGATTNVTFTFTAITGSTAEPGWTDTVTTTGTTLTMINAFYLGASGTGNTTSVATLPLRRTSPTMSTLWNYDTDRDAYPGRFLTRRGDLNSNDRNKVQRWNMAVGGSPLTISGTASLRIWSAVKDFDLGKTGSLMVGLYDCDAAATTCTQLSFGQVTSTGSWTGGQASLVLKNITLAPAGSYTFAANRVFQVRVGPSNDAQGDLMIAYDTTTYRTALIITP